MHLSFPHISWTKKRIIVSVLIFSIIFGGAAAVWTYEVKNKGHALDIGGPYAVSFGDEVWFADYKLNHEIFDQFINAAEKNPQDNRHPDQNDCNVTGQLYWANAFNGLYEGLPWINSSNPNSNALVKTCWHSSHLDNLYSLFWPDLRSNRNLPYFTLEEIQRIRMIKKHKDDVFLASGYTYPVENPLEWLIFPSEGQAKLVAKSVNLGVEATKSQFVKVTFIRDASEVGAKNISLLYTPVANTTSACVSQLKCQLSRAGERLAVAAKDGVVTVTRGTGNLTLKTESILDSVQNIVQLVIKRREAGLNSESPEVVSAMQNFLKINDNDPLFGVNGRLPARGGLTNRTAMTAYFDMLAANPGMISTINESVLFHGSNSSSLLAFTEYGGKGGDLIPLGQLELQGKVPFSGEIAFGREVNSVNYENLSTVFGSSLSTIIQYARPSGWNPAKGMATIAEGNAGFVGIAPGSPLYRAIVNTLEVEQKRLVEWSKLTPVEKSLVQEGFPVMYGIRSSRSGIYTIPAVTKINGEIAMKGGALAGEIKAIFVPKNRIGYVKQLIGSSHPEIKVGDISTLPAYSKY